MAEDLKREGEIPDDREKMDPGEEDRFREFGDQLPQPVFEADGRGVLTLVNQSAFETFGYTEEDLRRGLNCMEMIAPVDRERAGGNIEEILRGGKREGTEYLMLKKDGSTFPAMMHSAPVLQDGRAVGMRGVVTNLNEIRNAEERLLLLEKVIEDVPDGIQIVDLEGRILYSNMAVEGIYGYSPEEFRGRHVNELNVDPTYAGEVIVPAIREHGRWEGEVLVTHKEGHSFPIWLNTSIVKNADGSPAAMVGTIKDLTKRKRAEEALRRSEELYRTVIENTGTAMLIVEEDTTISFANQEMEDFSGISRDELLDKPIPFDLISQEQQETVRNHHRRRRETPDATPRSYEISFKNPGGSEKHALLTVAIIPGSRRSVVSLVDVTERVVSQRDLEESEAKFRNLAENSPNMIFINQEGRIVYANPLCERILGFTRDELYSPDFDFRRLIAPDSTALVGEMYAAHRSGRDVPPYEYGLLAKGGERIDVINSARLITYQGRPALLGIVMDISARKKAEADLEKAYEELEAQNLELRMLDEMKDTLIRDVSHELKTPVAKHSMQLEILKPLAVAHRLSEEEQKALVVMEESIRRQESVIRNLLDLSRLEAGEKKYRREPVRLDQLLAKTVEDYRYATDVHGMEVDLKVSPLTISSDEEMLWHLFSNIVNNAIKFRRKGVPGRISVTAQQLDGEVRVIVRDDGIGMDTGDMDRAFSRFYQASASYEGSGVGLTICRMIVQGLGGRILLDSEGSGKGLTATVALPFSPEL